MLRIREAGAGLTADRDRCWRLVALGLAIASIVIIGGGTRFSAQVRRPSGRPAAPASARHPPFKAIFEPRSLAEDVEISDVFFADAETGWACGHRPVATGDLGFIVATRDGGRSWSAQLGGAGSPMPACTHLFFFDAAHGWATRADGVLLRTRDGSIWVRAGDGTMSGPLAFIGPERGFRIDGSNMLMTDDGGRRWAIAYRCGATDGVADVVRSGGCQMEAMAFAPDRATGYVVARMATGRSASVIKTTDGGNTWALTAAIPETDARNASLVFVDAETGYLRAGRVLSRTSDGGRTWHAVEASVPPGAPKILFAGPVGWLVGGREFTYTLDGGKRWNVRTIDFPEPVSQFSLPAADTGYVVGSHGMVYRYRVVPFDYSVPRMLAIPAMSALAPNPPSPL